MEWVIMGYGERAVEAVDWRNLEVLQGASERLPAALLALFRSATNAEFEPIWRCFENVVFSQDTIYGAAEEVVNVLLAGLTDERPRLVRSWIIELLFFLLKGGSQTDPSLPARCRERALSGLWLLGQEARLTKGRERELVLKVVESIDSRYAEFMRDTLDSTI
jgi:hypothetical protein